MHWLIRRRHIPFLIVGHPRCGTTSAAVVCREMNVDIGDEYVGSEGISSWMMAVDDRANPYTGNKLGGSRRYLKWDTMILVVRDIREAVPSVMIENKYAPASTEFRARHILKKTGCDIRQAPDEMAMAAQSIVLWTRIILEQNPDLWFRIEDQQQKFRDFVLGRRQNAATTAGQSFPDIVANATKSYDNIVHEKPKIAPDAWGKLPSELRQQIAQYCDMFGYQSCVS
jgi:hypothetical protein